MTPRILVGLLLSVIAVATVMAGEAEEQQWLVSLKVTEALPQGGARRVLAEPMIVCTESFAFLAGGNVASDQADEAMEVGTRVTGKIKSLAPDQLQLSLSVRLAALASQPDDADSQVVVADTIEVRSRLRPGETRQYDCGRGRMCEVRIESADENHSAEKSQTTTASKYDRGYIEVEARKR